MSVAELAESSELVDLTATLRDRVAVLTPSASRANIWIANLPNLVD